jgi:hypothetical protein
MGFSEEINEESYALEIIGGLLKIFYSLETVAIELINVDST